LKNVYTQEYKESRKAEGNPYWKGGLPSCLDCGEKLKDYRSKRCPKCAKVYLAITYKDLRVAIGKRVGTTSKMSKEQRKSILRDIKLKRVLDVNN
jgi:hypothetical protein